MSKKVKTLYSFLALQFLLPAYRCTCHLEASQSTAHIQSVSVQKHSLGTYRQGQAMRRLSSVFSASGIPLLKLCCNEVIYFEIASGQESAAGRLVVAGILHRCCRSAQTSAESDHIQVCQRHRMPTVQQRRRDPGSPPVFRISTQVLQKLRCQLWSILGLHEGSPSFVFLLQFCGVNRP